MDSLSPKGSDLIRAARRSLRATAADRERVENSLRAVLGPEALPLPDLTPAPPVTPPAYGGPMLAKLLVGAGLVGSALAISLSGPATPAPKPSAPVTQPATVQPSEAPVSRDPPPAEQPPQQVEETRQAAAARPATRRQESLAQEVLLLSRATSALKAGRAADALRAVAVHQRRFPAGIMAEERRVAKAQALCLLDRVREARAELDQLDPDSPAVAHAAQLCDKPTGSSH